MKRWVYELENGAWDLPELRRLLEEIVPQNALFENFELEHAFPRVGRKKLLLNARRIEQAGDRPSLILLAMEDVPEHQRG